MKKIYSLLTLVATPLLLLAQNEADALKYSFNQLHGTPRILGMGGSGSAMGADLFSLVSNPAGLAQSRNNYYSLSLGYTNTNNNSFYINQNRESSIGNFSLPAIGASFTNIQMDRGREVKHGLVSYTLALSVQRTANYNRKMSFQGYNSSSSILDHFANLAYGYSPSELNASTDGIPELAWQNYLIDYDNAGQYYYASLPDTISMQQSNVTEENGRGNNFNFGFGLNFSHAIYFGASLSLRTLRFENNSYWTEVSQTTFNPARKMTYDYGYTTTGTSAQLTIGMIANATENIRIGASYQTGSRFNMYEEYYYKMSSTNFPNTGSYYSGNSNLLSFNYTLRTPQKIQAAVSFLIPKRAIFNVDVDVIDYSTTRLNSDGYGFETENNTIYNSFRKTYNFKTGAEILQGPMRYRAGFAYSLSPLKKNITPSNSGTSIDQKTFTLGLGYKNSSGFFVDAAYTYTWFTDYFTPYQLNSTTRESYTAVNDLKRSQFVVGIGSYF